jgi:hypothetical protein
LQRRLETSRLNIIDAPRHDVVAAYASGLWVITRRAGMSAATAAFLETGHGAGWPTPREPRTGFASDERSTMICPLVRAVNSPGRPSMGSTTMIAGATGWGIFCA